MDKFLILMVLYFLIIGVGYAINRAIYLSNRQKKIYAYTYYVQYKNGFGKVLNIHVPANNEHEAKKQVAQYEGTKEGRITYLKIEKRKTVNSIIH